MKHFLNTVRLSHYFILLVVAFGGISLVAPEVELASGALTLFSVNSFLFGFYLSPIFSAQKQRIDTIHALVRNEASQLYSINQYSKRLDKDYHKGVAKTLTTYAQSAYTNRDVQGEKEFEKLMDKLSSYAGQDTPSYIEMMKAGSIIQQNRAEINRLLNERVYRNEWIVMLILFSITVTFILLIELPNVAYIHLMPPILASGLSMLMIILAKMSALTHKRASTIWDSLNNLTKSHFHNVNDDETTSPLASV